MIFVILNLNLKVSNMQGTELMFLCYTVYLYGFAMFTKILVKVLFQAIDIIVFFTSNFI